MEKISRHYDWDIGIAEVQALAKNRKKRNIQKKPTIRIIDALPGTGKTTAMFDVIKDSSLLTQWLYITPLLSEVDRVTTELNYKGKDFLSPPNEENGLPINKTEWVLENWCLGVNIVTTHQLFKRLKDLPETVAQHNTLVLDETIDVFDRVPIPAYELRQMIGGQTIGVDDNNKLFWTYKTKKEEITDKSGYTYMMYTLLETEKEDIYLAGNTAVWELDISALYAFDVIYILTYNFAGTLLEKYLQSKGFTIEYIDVPLRKSTEEAIEQLKDTITFADTSDIEALGYTLSSSSWFDVITHTPKRLTDFKKVLQQRLTEEGVTITEVLYTSPKDYARDIIHYDYESLPDRDDKKDKLYYVWLPAKTKATNEYAHKTKVVYLYNKFFDRAILNHMSNNRGITIYKAEEDTYALNELLQFIFRSAIREGNPITLYLPSVRMRNLLKKHLGLPIEEKYKAHHNSKLTDKQKENLIKDAKEGYKKTLLAKKYGIGRQHIYTILKQAGIE